MLPAHLVKEVFEKSVKLAKVKKSKQFEEYLRQNYINEDSPFPPSSWAGLTFKTTNNGAESFHRHFGDLFGYLHTKPNIWEFLRTIRLYNELKDTKIVSKKTVKETTDFWTIHIEEYINKKINAVKLLDKLSIKCQPKMSLKKNR